MDFGFGATPATTVELRAALPDFVRLAAVEQDLDDPPPDVPGVTFLCGGFALPEGARPARLVRAMNVLRGYPVSDCARARALLGEALLEGGVLVEGTCGPRGEVSVSGWHHRRRDGLRLERVLFSTTFERGFAPLVFRDRLPRDLRGFGPETALAGLFRDWCAAYAAIAPATRDPRARFVAAADALASARADVPRLPADWAAGRLWWAPPAGARR